MYDILKWKRIFRKIQMFLDNDFVPFESNKAIISCEYDYFRQKSSFLWKLDNQFNQNIPKNSTIL